MGTYRKSVRVVRIVICESNDYGMIARLPDSCGQGILFGDAS